MLSDNVQCHCLLQDGKLWVQMKSLPSTAQPACEVPKHPSALGLRYVQRHSPCGGSGSGLWTKVKLLVTHFKTKSTKVILRRSYWILWSRHQNTRGENPSLQLTKQPQTVIQPNHDFCLDLWDPIDSWVSDRSNPGGRGPLSSHNFYIMTCH